MVYEVSKARKGILQLTAQDYLGNLFYKGEGVVKNDEKAKQWWLKAARQGSTNAQHKLKAVFGIS